MAHVQKITTLLAVMLALGGCSGVPATAYYNRGDPENLIDISSERIHVSLTSAGVVTELGHIIQDDPPTRAELYCAPGEILCMRAMQLFERNRIPAAFVAGGPDREGIALVYERIMARDCENRYLDNSSNVYNLPPPTFGCSITGNMVQMVTDKREFTNPALMDYHDAEKIGQAYEKYLKPASESDNSMGGDSLLGSVSSSR